MRFLPILSYAANGVLIAVLAALYFTRASNGPSRVLTSNHSVVVTTSAPPPHSVREPSDESQNEVIRWDRQALPAILERLRKAGAPPLVLYHVTMGLLAVERRQQRDMIRFQGGTPRWQGGISLRSTEAREALKALSKSHDEESRRLLGDDYEKALAELSGVRLSRFNFGGLSAEKRSAIEELVREYSEAEKSTGRSPLSPASVIEMERRMAEDLRSFLTAREVDEFMAYNSQSASALQSALVNVKGVDDQEYLRLYQAYSRVWGLEDGNALRLGDLGGSSEQFRVAELQALSAVARPELTLQIVSAQIPQFQELSTAYGVAQLSSTQLLDRYRDYLGVHRNLMAHLNPEPGETSAQHLQRRADTARQGYQLLVNGLPADARAAFDQTRMAKFLLRVAATK